MKLYNPEPEKIIRLSITNGGYEGAQYINLVESTPNEVLLFVKKLIEEQKISPFTKGRRTRIDIRECTGGKNGKSISLSFIGISVSEVTKLILNNIK